MSLKGKVVLVTGARQGLGKSISLGMAEEGADLVICDRVTDDGKLASDGVYGFSAEMYGNAGYGFPELCLKVVN